MLPATAIRRAIAALGEGRALTEGEMRAALGEVMTGEAPPPLIAALLLALRARGETDAEVAGAARALRDAMRRLELPDPAVVDTCGTGGGRVRTLNISTAAALVTAAAGVPVAKHGNRSFTSRSGSADVLEALDVPIELPAEATAQVFAEAGIVFLFAPTWHPAMRHVGPVRRELGVPTIMNLVGPLANPAGVTRQVVGVADARHGPLMAGALARLGAEHALVVHAEIGLDELSPLGRSMLWEVRRGTVREAGLDPADFGLATPDLTGTEGGEPAENAAAIRALLASPGSAPIALRAAVLLNAAAAIVVSGQAEGMHDAVERAKAALDGGAAAERLELLRRATAVRTSG